MAGDEINPLRSGVWLAPCLPHHTGNIGDNLFQETPASGEAVISNPDEEKALKTPQYRQQIAESLLNGVRSYAETLSGVKTAKSIDRN